MLHKDYDSKGSVEQALTTVKEALKGNDVTLIRSTKDELTKVSHKLADAIYKASQNQNANTDSSSQQGSHTNTEEKVVDAEVVEDKDKK